MPLEVLHQIKYLCKNIPKVEWSGILFYTTEGSIEKPASFKIRLQTILPLDMGTSAFTEYELDERFINFLEEDFETRAMWKVGHIHSHNVMGVFFSGTDKLELSDNAGAHNYYLSLIVNNYMDFVAKVAFIGTAKKEIKQVPYMAMNSEGNSYEIEREDFVVDENKLFIYDCEISSPKDIISVEDSFAAQVTKIMEPKLKPALPPKYTPTNLNQTHQNFRPNVNQNPKQPFNQTKREETWASKSFDFSNKIKKEIAEELDGYTERRAVVENFAKDLFNFGTPLSEDEDFEDVLTILSEFNLTPLEIATAIVEDYDKDFAETFPNASAADFVQITHEVLDYLEEWSSLYPEIKMTIRVLTSLIDKFIQHDVKPKSTSTV